MTVRILIVEDERRMANHIGRALCEEAFAVDIASDGVRGLELARTYEYDAIVLDLMLPQLDGLSVCRSLRDEGRKVPVLIVSARDMVEDRVRGLDAGADDYLVKPFAIVELTARLRALQRRRQATGPGVLLVVGTLKLDPSSRTVCRDGRAIPMTAKEYALLEYFMRRTGSVLTRTMIAEHVWDFTFDRASNVVDVYVKHLRDKIDVAGEPSLIQAVRGVGYVFRDPYHADA
jgi:DNA-binding response OmpR family regulator